jgi:hypothetical protein
MTVASLTLLLLAQAAGPDRVILTGTVVGTDGKPAAGADVVLTDDASPLIPPGRITGGVVRPPAVLETRRAEADGRFRVGLLEHGEIYRDPNRRPVFLWAFGPRGALAMRPIPDAWPRDGEPIRLVLGQPGPVRFLVLDPEERPVADARLVPARVRGMNLPNEMGDRLAARTDAQGRATLDIGAADEVDVVRVTSGNSGVQQHRMTQPDAAGVRTLRLLPVGRVVGQIQAGNPQAVRGLPVRVRTDPDPTAEASGVGGFASVVTDEQGRFTIPAMAEGTLRLSIELHRDLPWRGQPRTSQPQVRPGTTTEVAISLQRAGLVKGIVQETSSRRPIAGVGVRLSADLDAPLARSDAEGRISTYILPGRFRINPVDLPRGYDNPSQVVVWQTLPEGTSEFTMQPIEVSRGVELHGRVLDSTGMPVPAATVAGHFEKGNGSLGGRIGAVTNCEGRFGIAGLPLDATAYLSAVRGEATTAAPISVPSGRKTIDLTVRPENAVALHGRARDAASRPVAGAVVRVTARKRNENNLPVEQFTVSFDDEGRTTVQTGTDGQFRTPKQLRPDLEYRVDVEADGWVPASSEWIQPADRKLWYLPALVLQPSAPARAVVGRVVDSQGRPIAGAAVFQSGDGPVRSRTTTDADGRFRLSGVYREPAWLFVEADGLTFEGHRIGAGNEAVELKVRRVGEPFIGPPFHTLPPVLPRDEEKALAHRLIGSDLSLLTGEATRETYPLVRALPRVDFDRAWELVENRAVGNPQYSELLRRECANVLAATSLEEAATVAETLKEPSSRSFFYYMTSDALPGADRARKVDLLNKALLHARADTDPGKKVSALGRVGYRLLDLGEIERGTQVLREGQRLADTLPNVDRGPNSVLSQARGAFASHLARIDARAGRELAEGLVARDSAGHRSGVALALADRDPAESEQILGKLPPSRQRDQKVIRAAGRMAAIDRDRARRLIETLAQPRDQALALGAMAQTLADIDKKAASALIDEAFRRLEKLAQEAGDRPMALACVAAGHLLPTAEKIDPELLRTSFWRAVAMRPPRPSGGDPSGSSEQGAAALAITLARYDRAVARQVLEPAAARARSLVDRTPLLRGHELFAAAAVIDPTWAVALADALPDDTPGTPIHPKATIRRAIAEVLAYDGAERWDQLESSYLGFERDSGDSEWW